uniref:Amino acid transporter transmembrane domain-containing protein n=1 Tax=Ditylenchus dipsaci TaxID=166011 RepID=A0A915DNA1_9BILA
MFVVGVQAGGGLVALPTAMVRVGFWTGMLLSVQRWPEEYTGSHCRKPYPEIGYRALGPRMRSAVSFTINITMFGIAVVFLVLSSKNIHDFLKVFFNINLSYCIIAIVLALLILPIVLLKSPKDFW